MTPRPDKPPADDSFEDARKRIRKNEVGAAYYAGLLAADGEVELSERLLSVAKAYADARIAWWHALGPAIRKGDEHPGKRESEACDRLCEELRSLLADVAVALDLPSFDCY